MNNRPGGQDALTESEWGLRQIVENISEVFWMTDAGKDRMLYVSPAYERIWGRSCASLYADPKNWLEAIHPEDRGRVLQAALTGQASGEYAEEYRIVRPDGSLRWIRDRATPVRDPEGRVQRIVGVAEDITARVTADERIRLQSAALEAVADPVCITDRDGTILAVNKAFARQTGWSLEAAAGKNPRILKSGLTDPKVYPRMWAAILEGRTWTGEVVNRRRDGGTYVAELTIAPVRGVDGTVAHFVSTHRDLTEKRSTEEALAEREAQLRQAHKMEAVGRLAGGVAHDFNNLLTVILGCSTLLLENLGPDDANRADVLEIAAAGGRAAALTKQLLAFSRKQVLQPRRVDLQGVLDGVESMLTRLIGEGIELKVLSPGRELVVMADCGQLEQVVINLVINARDAISGSGKIIIEAAASDLEEAHVHRHGTIPPGSYVVLTVSDTGCGMDEVVQSNAFEPFFTTKETGKGTGLGLPMVYGFVAQSNGHVTVYSEVGRGTTFNVYLPRLLGQAEDPGPAAPEGELPEGTGTVLLVEDEASVRQLARRALIRNGFTVIATGDPLEALAVCERHADPIRILITDIVMPGLSGLELAQKALAACPKIPVLYLSGYSVHIILKPGGTGLKGAFLQKPFAPKELLRKVHEILGCAQSR